MIKKVNYKILVTLLLFIVFSIYVISNSHINLKLEQTGSGCCEDVCKELKESDCPGKYHHGKSCFEINECNVGCCIDNEGYCFSNYLEGNCIKNGFTFISEHECDNHFECLFTNEDSLVGFTGLNVNKKEDASDSVVSYIESNTHTKGDKFTIKYMAPFSTNKDVKARINYDGYEKTIKLYDDGMHDDGNKDDGLYAGKWDSSDYLHVHGIQKIPYSIIVDGELVENTNFNIIISSNTCSPLVNQFNKSNRNIIFIISSDVDEFSDYKEVAYFILNSIVRLNALSIHDYNYLIVNKPIGLSDVNFAKNFIESSCTNDYNPSRDFVFFIDKNYNKCTINSRFIHLSPMFFINSNKIREYDNYLDLMNNFCDVIILEDELNATLNPQPYNATVTINHPLNHETYSQNLLEVNFTITHNSDDDLEFEIFNEGVLLHTGYSNKSENFSFDFNFDQGSHRIWIEVDLEYEMYISNFVEFAVS
ncbi:MAG: hypothetical protein ACOC3X_02775 [Nanoarchaeota archaeon]